jgi:hypothetical protein
MAAAEHPLSDEELMELLDGELPFERAAIVQAHIAGCDRCQGLTRQLRGVSRDLARWQIEQPPATLVVPAPRATTRGRAFASWLVRPSPVFAVAGVAIAVFLGGAYRLMSIKPMLMTAARPTIAQAPAPSSTARAPLGSEPQAFVVPRSGKPAAAPAAPLTSGPMVAAQGPLPSSIARTAVLRITAVDVDGARPVIDRVVSSTGSLTRTLTVSGADGARSLTATLLIPAGRFDESLAALKVIGRVTEETMRSDDVKEQIVDLDARLKNARTTEARLNELLRTRTGALADVLAAEREVARVREEIERLDAERRNLGERITYASLNLHVQEERHPTIDLGPQPVSGMLRDSLVAGVTTAVDSILGLALLLVRVLPSLTVWALILAWPARAAVRWLRATENRGA